MFPGEQTAIESIQQRGVEQDSALVKGLPRDSIEVSNDGEAPHAVVPGITVRGYIFSADHSASAHVGRLPVAQFDADTILARCNLTWKGLFEHQSKAATVNESALLVAPTGSGKTEAALLWAARQSSITAGNLPRLFYTLPYQASMNAMQERLEYSFQNLVGLQHGRSLLALYRDLLERDYSSRRRRRTHCRDGRGILSRR